jgi:hypothetical protein
MLGRDPVLVIGTVTKLGVDGGEDLFGGRRTFWKCKTVSIVVVILKLVEDSIFRIRCDGGREGESRG